MFENSKVCSLTNALIVRMPKQHFLLGATWLIFVCGCACNDWMVSSYRVMLLQFMLKFETVSPVYSLLIFGQV